MRDTFRGGVHPRERKELSKEASLRRFDAKGEMVFPLAQHIGKPAKAIVKKGDPVLVGQCIGAADGFVSANVISSCSGTVKAVEKRRTIAGVLQECIVIDNDGQYTETGAFDKKQDITGIIYEPWHFRYVGVEAATYIMENGLCLEEFLELYK